MTLIYFFTENSESKWLINDFIRLSFRKCLIFYYSENLTHINNFISELKSKIKPQELEIINIDKLTEAEEELNKKEIIINDHQDFLQKADESLFTIYLKEVNSPSPNKSLKFSLLNSIKAVIESLILLQEKKNKKEIKLIVDLTNCSLVSANLVYFLLLKYISEYNIKNINIMTWDLSSNRIIELPTIFLDTTSQLFLDLIASGTSTVKELQEKYTRVKDLNKTVSQPFVSKYISKMLKLDLISEDWIEGFKNFYLNDNGYLHVHSNIERAKYKELISKELTDLSDVSTVNLTQKLIISYKNNEFENTNKFFQEILVRKDIEREKILLIVKKLKEFDQNQIKGLLEMGLKLHKNSAELMTSLANIHYHENNPKRAFALCKEAVKIDPDYPEAWKLLGKLTFSEK